jgi:hypothetical protein
VLHDRGVSTRAHTPKPVPTAMLMPYRARVATIQIADRNIFYVTDDPRAQGRELNPHEVTVMTTNSGGCSRAALYR